MGDLRVQRRANNDCNDRGLREGPDYSSEGSVGRCVSCNFCGDGGGVKGSLGSNSANAHANDEEMRQTLKPKPKPKPKRDCEETQGSNRVQAKHHKLYRLLRASHLGPPAALDSLPLGEVVLQCVRVLGWMCGRQQSLLWSTSGRRLGH